jgi:hypothetical protein
MRPGPALYVSYERDPSSDATPEESAPSGGPGSFPAGLGY